jgi:hypothetical protein
MSRFIPSLKGLKDFQEQRNEQKHIRELLSPENHDFY